MTSKITTKGSGNPKQTTQPDKTLLQASRSYTVLNHLDPKATYFIPMEPAVQSLTAQELMLAELQAARLLNIGMPADPKAFIALLEARIAEITGTKRNAILILDEESGTYTCLNDEIHEEYAQVPRELTWISDTYLQDLLGSEQVIHSFLQLDGNIFGIVAIADKLDGSAFTRWDELLLEQLNQYLSVQINHFLTLKRSLVLPSIQKILLQLSNALLSAVDSTAIYQAAMEILCQELPFTAGQYIFLDRESGTGHVQFQMGENGFEIQAPGKTVEQFASMLSLFQSQVWKYPYLYLKGEMLGDKSFAELFGLPDVVSVLFLPFISSDNQIEGALVLFQQKNQVPLSKDALSALEQAPGLIASACARAEILEKALELATTDELTGAVNRRGFYSQCDAEVDRARRNQRSMCIAIIDVDHFKLLNDTYGHLAGDQILRRLSELIHQNIRKSDLLCRFGGEEFALLLPETSLRAAMELLERLRRKVERLNFQTDVGPVKVTFSGGIDLIDIDAALSKGSLQLVSESLARADEALYEAKQLGRNRIISARE